jgi:hypothetical protein
MLLWNCGSGRDEEPAAKILRLIQIRIATASFEKSWHLVKPIRRKRESPIRVPQTRSASRPHAQRNAFCRRDGIYNPDRLPVGINR